MSTASGAASGAARRRSPMRAFRHRDFAVFWTAAAISNGGAWMQVVALPALLFDMTDSSTWLGLASLASLLPAVVLTPFAGVLADRISRRSILLATQAAQMATAFALWGLYSADALTPGLILGVGVASGIATGFQAAVWQSFVPLLVPPDEILDAVELNSVQFTLARALGPAFAGLVVTTIGFGAAFAINGFTYALVIVALVVARPRTTPRVGGRESVVTVLVEGARYMWSRAPLRLAVGIAFLTSVCGQSLQHVAPAIAARVFGRPSTANAGLLVALGLGALASSAFTVVVGDRMARSTRMTIALGLYALSTALLPLTSEYWVGLVAFFLAGIAHLQTAVALNTLIQGTVPEEIRGRAMSFYVLAIIAGIPLGAFVLGRLGDTLGMRTALVLDALVLTTAVAALLMSRRIALFDADRATADVTPA